MKALAHDEIIKANLSVWQGKLRMTDRELCPQLPSETSRCVTSSLAQNDLNTSFSFSVSEPHKYVSSFTLMDASMDETKRGTGSYGK